MQNKAALTFFLVAHNSGIVMGISTVSLTLKFKIMGNLLYVVAVILIIGWAIGFFAYSAGGLIHILLVIAIIAILLKVIGGRSSI